MKSVRFQDEKNLEDIIFPTTDSCDNADESCQDESDNSWYDAEDYENFKKNSRWIARQSRCSKMTALLDDILSTTDSEVSSSLVQAKLSTWSRLCLSRRGLERWINLTHGALREENKSMHRTAVLFAQQRYKQYGNILPNFVEIELAKISQRYSSPARQYAVTMGIADAFAVEMEEKSPLSNTIITKRGVMGERRRVAPKIPRKVFKFIPKAA